MNTPNGWGPSHEQIPRWRTSKRLWQILAAVVFVFSPIGQHIPFIAILFVGALGFWWARLHRHAGHDAPAGRGAALSVSDSSALIRAQHHGHGASVYLGRTATGAWRFSRAERAVLILGPPRSGKTSTVMIPSIIGHAGPVVSTSTKPDVLAACGPGRSTAGRVWQFDPAGIAPDLPGTQRLRWSPLSTSRSWDGALLMAQAMIAGAAVGTGSTNATHWARRAQALLAALLHAAAVNNGDMVDVLDWVAQHECDQPNLALEKNGPDSRLAAVSLIGVANCETRERAAIFSSTADALEAYTATGALAASEHPNFDAGQLVNSQDSVFIHAPADRQTLAAPLVCGLLAEIRQATYNAHRANELKRRVLFALDEVANIAPIQELPAIASEGGSQGLLLLAALQDLSQARVRWGGAADGFLTLFGTKLILPGIADQRTLETISIALGEYDRQVLSHNQPRGLLHHGPDRRSITVSTQRTRTLSPGEIANIPAGHGLHLDGINWELLTLTPAHTTNPWQALTAGDHK